MRYLRACLACTLLLTVMLVPTSAFAGAEVLNSEVTWLSAEYGWTDATNGGLTLWLNSGFFEDGVQMPAEAGVSGFDIEHLPGGAYYLTRYEATFSGSSLLIDTQNGTVCIQGSAPLRITESYHPYSGATIWYPERVEGEMTADLSITPSADGEKFSGYGGRCVSDFPMRIHVGAQRNWAIRVTGTATTSGGLDLTPRTAPGGVPSSSGQLMTYRMGTVFLPEQVPVVVE